MSSGTTWVAQLLASAFLAVLFLQSGLDKVFDWSGNRAWLREHFAKSPLARVSTLLLVVLTGLEVLAGVVCSAGTLSLFLTRQPGMALVGAVLSAACILCLFTGQRLAKDYAGAAGLVPYALFSIGSVLLMGWGG